MEATSEAALLSGSVPGHEGVRRLSHRAHDHRVDIDVGGALQGPHDRLGDVFGDERGGNTLVDAVGGLLGAEPVKRKFLGAHHTGCNLDDAHRFTHQLLTQRVRDDAFGVLGGHVAAATRVGVVGGGRGEEDEVSPALAHPRQEGA